MSGNGSYIKSMNGIVSFDSGGTSIEGDEINTGIINCITLNASSDVNTITTYTNFIENNTSSSITITGNTTMTGALTAASKSFDIPHPTKEGYRLRYGVLEGPEHGVYFRGRTIHKIINLPDYWTGLIDENSITVHLTPIKGAITHDKQLLEE